MSLGFPRQVVRTSRQAVRGSQIGRQGFPDRSLRIPRQELGELRFSRGRQVFMRRSSFRQMSLGVTRQVVRSFISAFSGGRQGFLDRTLEKLRFRTAVMGSLTDHQGVPIEVVKGCRTGRSGFLDRSLRVPIEVVKVAGKVIIGSQTDHQGLLQKQLRAAGEVVMGLCVRSVWLFREVGLDFRTGRYAFMERL